MAGAAAVYNTDPTKPMGSWKSAWTTCRKAAGGGQAACSSAHLHLRPRRSRSAGINHEGHRRLDVSQDAGTVFAHSQSGEAGRGQQAPAPEASVGDFLRFTLVGPPGVHPNSPQSVIFALQRRNELALTLPLECVPLTGRVLGNIDLSRSRRGGGNVGIGFIDFQGLREGWKKQSHRFFHAFLRPTFPRPAGLSHKFRRLPSL